MEGVKIFLNKISSESMNCPYCKAEMTKGVICGDRYALKWIPGENSYTPFHQLKKGIKLTNFLDSNSVESYYCEVCKKIVIDIM